MPAPGHARTACGSGARWARLRLCPGAAPSGRRPAGRPMTSATVERRARRPGTRYEGGQPREDHASRAGDRASSLRSGSIEPGSLPGVVRSVRAALLALGPRAWSLRVRALEALTDRRDVERQVLERLDGTRGEREREVLPLFLGAGLAGAPRDLGALARTTRHLRPRVVRAPGIAEQLAQHPLRQLQELAWVRPVGRHGFPSRLVSSASRWRGRGRPRRRAQPTTNGPPPVAGSSR